VSEELLVIETSWPGTMIGGEPGIVSGILTVSSGPGGEFLLNLSVGPIDRRPADCEYFEFPLSSEHARALRDVLS
jgi:hypothetical protein